MRRNLFSLAMISIAVLIHADGIKWEYTIVSFDDIQMLNPKSELFLLDKSKLLGYFSDLKIEFEEGIDLQSKMDILGQSGWELVLHMDRINAFVFRRIVNSDIIAIEKTEREKIIEQKRKVLNENSIQESENEIESEVETSNKIVEESLINIDEEERNKKMIEQNEKESNKAEEIKNSLILQGYTISKWEINADGRKKRINLYIDGTKNLLIGTNKYSQMAAKKYADEIGNNFRSLPGWEYDIIIQISINYLGSQKIVYIENYHNME